MQVKQLLLLYVTILIVMVAMNLVWIGVIAKNFYKKHIGDMFEFKVIPTILFYLIIPAAIVYFITNSNNQNSIADLKLPTVAVDCAILGFTAYATYNLTNLATIRNWSIRMSIVDTIWGTFVTSVSGTLGVIIARQFM